MTQTKESPPVNDSRSQTAGHDTPGRPSAATVRKVLIETIATNEPATVKVLEDEVGKVLPAAERPSVKQQLQILREENYVIAAENDRSMVILSDSGHRWRKGIEALAPRAA